MVASRLDRRAFLRALGLSGAAVGLGRAGLAFGHEGEHTAPIRRLIVLSHCHGWTYDTWKLRPTGLAEEQPWEADLTKLAKDRWSKALAPLYEHRARMLAVDGMSLATAELDMDGNRHDTGFVQAWTGNWVDFSTSPARARSRSLDQLVASHIASATQIPSLELSVDDINEPGRPIAYAANGKQMPVQDDAARVWQRVFGPSVNPDPLAAQRKAVLDYAYGEFKAAASGLEPGHKERLQGHFSLLHDLSKRLDGLATLQCAGAPEQPGVLDLYDDKFDAMAGLIGAAFACDVTRVVSLTLGELKTSAIGWDSFTDNVHKGLAHGIYDSQTKHDAMTDYLVKHSAQVARLVKTLEGIPDGDGHSLMDNTLIVWGSELADGWHGYRHYLPVILGGSWHFNSGRYLHKPHTTPIELLVPPSVSATGWSQSSGLPHQHLLVSVAQAMGLAVDHVGLEHTQGQRGDKVNLRGPVPGLV